MDLNLPIDTPTDVLQAKLRYGIVGNAPALIEAVSRAVRVAPIDLSVLITGESGTGKEFFPKIIHSFSPRKHSKYIAVNCGAIPEGTIDSELFGHEKGAFTGAVSSRKGYFEEADGGTVFLDEVAELPLTTQARLLRVLESGEFMKVGSSVVQKTNIRIVAATNVDMARAVAEGKFREDLFYRLSTVSIQLPPLRNRGNDILLLARKFASDFAERYRTTPITLDESAREAMLHYRWPGNVRQLKNIIDQVSLFEAGNSITRDTLRHYLPAISERYAPAVVVGGGSHSYEQEREMLFNMIFKLRSEIERLNNIVTASAADVSGASIATTAVETTEAPATSGLQRYGEFQPIIPTHTVEAERAENNIEDITAHEVTDDSPVTLEDTERETIRLALERNSGRRKPTALELKISERTLYRKIKEYGLEAD